MREQDMENPPYWPIDGGESLFDQTTDELLTSATPESASAAPTRSIYKEIRGIELLTREKELELVRRVSEGDELAREQLIEANLRLIFRLSERFDFDWSPQLYDKFQEASFPLFKAVDQYDPLASKLQSYIGFKTYFHLRRTAPDQIRTIHIPVYIEDSICLVDRMRNEMEKQLEKRVTEDELVAALSSGVEAGKFSEENVRLCLAMGAMDFVSLDTLTEENDPDSGLEATLSDDSQFSEDGIAEAIDAGRRIDSLMDCLTEKDRQVIRERFFNDKTLEEVGEQMGMTREGIRQIEMKSLNKMRQRARHRVLRKKNGHDGTQEQANDAGQVYKKRGRKGNEVATKKRILQAAVKFAEERGVENLTYSAVSDEIGINRITLARIFGRKYFLQKAVEREMRKRKAG